MRTAPLLIASVLLAGSEVSFCQSLNPAVTQATIWQTICKPGWATSVRPARPVMAAAKTRLMRAQGIPAKDRGLYILDHSEPIELGGSPDDPRNLLLQTVADSKLKDRAENFAHRSVCRKVRPVPLADAQKCFAVDWHSCPTK